MASCSNSSNISSSINSLSVVQGGSRLATNISYVSGLTVGDVIRYDIATAGYTQSKADNPANSEVFGVIDSFDNTTNKFSVVIYGSIGLSASRLVVITADGVTSGGSGGNDIYFLSGTTAGLLQNLAPSDLNQIIKPVYQAAIHGSYTGVVVNYLGYKLGGEVQSVLDDTELGNLQIVVGDNTFTDGYLDASVSTELPIVDYPDFYSKYGTQYGYVERLTTKTSPLGDILGRRVNQSNSDYTGEIIRVDTTNNYIYLAKDPTSSLASLSKLLNVEVVNLSFGLSAAAVNSAYSPIITLTNPLDIQGRNGSPSVTQTTKIGIKVQPQGVMVSVPRTVTVSSLVAGSVIVGSTASLNVESVINDFESRITVIENRLGIPT
jgi:hypothetical protein